MHQPILSINNRMNAVYSPLTWERSFKVRRNFGKIVDGVGLESFQEVIKGFITILYCTVLNLCVLGSSLWRRRPLMMVGEGIGRVARMESSPKTGTGSESLHRPPPLSPSPTVWAEFPRRHTREQARCISPGVSHYEMKSKHGGNMRCSLAVIY